MIKNKIILFDLDGTLIDSTDAIVGSFEVAYAHHNEKMPDTELIKAQIGHTLENMFLSFGVEARKVNGYISAYRKHYRQISCTETRLLDGAKEAIVLAYENAHLGVVTTKTGLYSIELLEYMGLMNYFEVLVGSEDVVYQKPHPEPIYKALKQLPEVTGGVWMVGDTCLDMIAAREANIDGMAVLCGYGSEDSLMKCSNKIYQNSLQAIQFIANK